jgi:hypothetical protein
MAITRTFSASLLALAAIMGSVAPGYAAEPCCDLRQYINVKTGKEVKPPRVKLRRGQSRALQVPLTGTVRNLRWKPIASSTPALNYIRATRENICSF